ncbi:MAG TPA: hypothetical protein VIH14_01695 [Anaerolineales bacterium]
MSENEQEKKKETDEEVKEDLQADRDDSLGYSREQITFEEEPDKPAEEKGDGKP